MQLNKNTKRKLALAIAAAIPAMSAGQAFAANNPIATGDLVVYQIGSSASDTASTSFSSLVIGELTTVVSQTSFVQSWDASTQTNPLWSSNAASTGSLALSDNATEITFNGYGATASTETNVLNRGAGVISLAGVYSQPVNYTGTATNQARSAFSPDGSNFYLGDKGGLYYNAGTAALTGSINSRSVKGFGGTTYDLTASSTAGVGVVQSVSPATPANTTVTLTTPNGIVNDNNAVDFYMVSSQNNGVYDTLYYTDTTVGGIVKYGLQSGTWTAEGTDTTPGATIWGIAAQQVPGGVNLFYTTSAQTAAGSQVFEVEDTSGQSGSLTNLTGTVIYTAPTGDSLRGLVLVPEPASFGLMLMGGSLLALRRRRAPTA